ncbi:MAG: MGDG synthase family glycosyltransferase [Anaerovoracaceae bacterium]|jgi:processive 1,2-diacylglycerol beta-glucosyltransferase
MNVMIITGEFGNGHVSAARALEQKLKNADAENEVVVIDIVRHLFPRASAAVYGVFDSVASHCSGIYNMMNRVDEHQLHMPMKRWFIEKFRELIDTFEPDLMISTWPVGARYIGAFKDCTGCDIPYITCITDITAHSEWLSASSDAYFVGDISIKGELARKGIDPEKIYVSGIPVRSEFSSPREVSGAGPAKVKNILIMGGGLGLIPGADELLDILTRDENTRVTVITGKNEKLKRRLGERFPSADVRGYVDSPAECMKRADWIITKAGGITTFEAIMSETPMLILPPFLEQESENAEYIVRRGLGVVLSESRSDWSSEIPGLLADDSAAGEITGNMRGIKREIERNDIQGVMERLGRTA